MGWFEFKLCRMSESDTTDPDWCFGTDDSLIKFTDGSTRWEIPGQGQTDRPGKTGWWYNKLKIIFYNFPNFQRLNIKNRPAAKRTHVRTLCYTMALAHGKFLEL